MAAPNSRVVAGIAAGVLALAGALVTKWEGTRHVPYRDAVGVLTVCEGHTGPDVIAGKTYSDDDCAAFKAHDLAIANAALKRCLPMPMLRQIEAALTDAVFNLGPQVVCGSTLQRMALANDWPGACAQLDRWNKAGGRELKGLTGRRGDERALCQGYR